MNDQDRLELELRRAQRALREMEDLMETRARELYYAMQRAENANHSKSTFLANMSHELRTPLNSVIGFANLLLKNKAQNLTGQDVTFLTRIRENGIHLLNLVNQVLDLSKIEAGRLAKDVTPVALDELIRSTLEQARGQLTDRSLELRFDAPRKLLPLSADESKLKQILINLIGNGIKFTQEGGVTVRVESDAEGRPLRIDVIDTGIGIPSHRLNAIFEPFEQVDSGTARQYGGTGLGLSISRSLCDFLGYRIEVQSVLGRGSIFSVVLAPGISAPHPLESAPIPPHPLEVLPPGSFTGRTVLVIDDDRDARIVISHHLEDLGCTPLLADSGAEGLRMAAAHRPDFITLDLLMPVMDGWEVLRRLKADPQLRTIPVVVVSIVARENRGLLLGEVEVVDKSSLERELPAALQRTLGSSRKTALVVEDDETIREMIAESLAREGLDVQEAANGREALLLLERVTPDVILLDLTMPVMDGVSFLETIRKEPRHARRPVIVITACDPSNPEVERIRTQAQAVVEKGKGLEESLKGLLAEILGRKIR